MLDILLENGAITQDQYDQLVLMETISADDVLAPGETTPATADSEGIDESGPDPNLEAAVEAEVARQIEAESPVKASYGSSGFRLETRDGNWQTNLQ